MTIETETRLITPGGREVRYRTEDLTAQQLENLSTFKQETRGRGSLVPSAPDPFIDRIRKRFQRPQSAGSDSDTDDSLPARQLDAELVDSAQYRNLAHLLFETIDVLKVKNPEFGSLAFEEQLKQAGDFLRYQMKLRVELERDMVLIKELNALQALCDVASEAIGMGLFKSMSLVMSPGGREALRLVDRAGDIALVAMSAQISPEDVVTGADNLAQIALKAAIANEAGRRAGIETQELKDARENGRERDRMAREAEAAKEREDLRVESEKNNLDLKSRAWEDFWNFVLDFRNGLVQKVPLNAGALVPSFLRGFATRTTVAGGVGVALGAGIGYGVASYLGVIDPFWFVGVPAVTLGLVGAGLANRD